MLFTTHGLAYHGTNAVFCRVAHEDRVKHFTKRLLEEPGTQRFTGTREKASRGHLEAEPVNGQGPSHNVKLGPYALVKSTRMQVSRTRCPRAGADEPPHTVGVLDSGHRL